ncbi:uncharacterized protein BDFB_006038, partial [Asbolus verrucosus]
LKFDLSSEEQRHRLENTEEAPVYPENRRWPWQNLYIDDNEESRKKEPDFDLELPERFRNFEEFLDRNQNELKSEDDLPIYYNSRPSFEDAYDEYRNLEKTRKFDRYNFRYLNNQILDDVRPYPHEDDFSFGDDEEGEEEMEVKSSHHGRDVHELKGEDERSHSHHMAPPAYEQKSHEEASGKGALENGKLEDPSQFAYPPTDSRFFQNIQTDDGDQKIQTKIQKLQDNKIHLSHRSDDGFSEETDQVEMNPDRSTDESMDVVAVRPQLQNAESASVYIIAVVAGISAAATVGLIAVGIGWYKNKACR